VVSEFIENRSFFALYGNPATREAAVDLLGRTLRRVHELPLPPWTTSPNPLEILQAGWQNAVANAGLPAFVRDAVQRVLAATPPRSDRPVVLSHNDVNPTNLVYDGERVLLFDWEVAGANSPLYDLAAISVFLRLDDEASRRLLAAHDGTPSAAVPSEYTYSRRLIAAVLGVGFLNLGQQKGFAESASGQSIDDTLSLAEFSQRLRSGAADISTAEGQWGFGLALVKESFTC
jgi:thiamine kinase-like enzyme